MDAGELIGFLEMYVPDEDEVFIRIEDQTWTILDIQFIDGKPMLLALEPGK